jgi:hypothetical protein
MPDSSAIMRSYAYAPACSSIVIRLEIKAWR